MKFMKKKSTSKESPKNEFVIIEQCLVGIKSEEERERKMTYRPTDQVSYRTDAQWESVSSLKTGAFHPRKHSR